MSFQAYKVSGNPGRKRTVPLGFELRRTMRLSVISWSISKKSIASSFTGCDMMSSILSTLLPPAQEPAPVDVLLSFHRSGRGLNPSLAFARATPERLVISGRVSVAAESAPNDLYELGAGECCILPKDEWHGVHLLERTQLLHITPGPRGDHRPLGATQHL